MNTDAHVRAAAEAISAADALLICAGAGMGVDSGLPDFRGDQGFWRAYPPYAKLGLSFREVGKPRWFESDPTFAWGFYGHRLNLYRSTRPHDGFDILRDWAESMSAGFFVYTSNVDGHFQRAGFDPDRIEEVHGAIDWMQCMKDCGAGIFAAPTAAVEIDEDTMRARPPLPACPNCGSLARPNILMFDDATWDYSRSYPQEVRFNRWLDDRKRTRLAIVECGAGLGLPTVRRLSEQVSRTHQATLVRINLREPSVPAGQIGLSLGALDGLRAIQAGMTSRKYEPAPSARGT